MAEGADQRRRWIRVRMGAIAALIVAGLLAVIGRVYYLQTVKREKLVDWARDQTSETVELRASRGEIHDRNGVELAVTTDVPSLYARPGKVAEPKEAARQIAPHLDADPEQLVETLTSESPFVWLERKAQPDAARAVEALEIRGIGAVTEHKRYYPLGRRAGQLLGFVGIDGNGLEGLERRLDETLSGETYEFSGMRDASGRTILSREVPDLGRLQGNTVELTIDERIQQATERAVSRQVEKWNAEAGYGVVLEVETGEILAMANTPAFDPNRFRTYEPNAWRLRPVTDTFEPGSVFKPFVLAAALEEETVSMRTVFDCEQGAMRIGGHTIRDSHPHEDLAAAEIIQKSSNIGAYKIARTIGRGRFYEYIRSFGFGSRTGLGIRGEQPGVLRPPGGWAEVTFANIAFGQGMTATPLQVATGMAVVANGGLLLEPRIVKEVREPEGTTVRSTGPQLVRRVVSEPTARRVAKAMSLVTLEEGTGTNAALEDFTVAGKTGTAQKVDPKTGEYAPDKWLASFVGFAPAEQPEVLALVMVDEPQETHYGGVVAAPAVRRILDKSLTVRGVVPLADGKEFDRSAYTDEKLETADGAEDAAPGERAVSESESEPSAPAEVLPAIPVGGESPRESGKRSAATGPRVPDLRGMTLGAALRRAGERGIRPRVEGWGRVVAQRPRPGAALRSGERLSLVLAPQRSVRPVSGEPAGGSDRSSASKD